MEVFLSWVSYCRDADEHVRQGSLTEAWVLVLIGSYLIHLKFSITNHTQDDDAYSKQA